MKSSSRPTGKVAFRLAGLRTLGLIGLAFAPVTAFGARSLIVPTLYVHNFMCLTNAWTDPSNHVCDMTHPYASMVEFSIRNISNIPQKVTINMTAPPGAIHGNMDKGGPALNTNWSIGGSYPEINQTVQSVNAVLGPAKMAGDTWNPEMGVIFYSSTNSHDGCGHFYSEFQFEVVVDEDRGAVSGTYETQLEWTCPYTTAINAGMLRNVSKSFMLNGGRPF